MTSFLVAVVGSSRSALAAGTPIDPRTLRVVSLALDNRHGERQKRLKNAVHLLEQTRPDLVLVQEIASGLFVSGDPLETLNATLQFNVQNYWQETNLGLYRTGMAVLSRYPVLEAEYHDFKEHERFEVKGYMRVKLETPLGIVQVVNVDLASKPGSDGVRRLEIGELDAFILGMTNQKSFPTLIGGSFGGNSAESAFQEWQGRLKLEAAPLARATWSEDYRNPCDSSVGEKRDHLLSYAPEKTTRRIQFMGTEVIPHTKLPHASDHCAVATVLEIVNASAP
ncbi:MAG: endonuclease/exonuclease/phosphatase family protein [Methylotenera sp.]|nr:endonuclease/exonuclease/phosphatase family protein [Oligoflexia bacterium]